MCRFLPYLGYHHILMMLIASSIILQAILLSGCSSSSDAIRSIYIVSYKYSPQENSTSIENSTVRTALAATVGQARLEVRVGYFGLCVSDAGSVEWTCSKNAHDLKRIFDHTSDPLDLINNGSHFKDDIIFPYLIIVAIFLELLSCCLLISCPGRQDEHGSSTGSDTKENPFHGLPISQGILALIFVAAIFTIISAFWQHFSASSVSTTMEYTGLSMINASVGSAAAALVWTSFFTALASTMGLFVMILAIIVLDKLTAGSEIGSGQAA